RHHARAVPDPWRTRRRARALRPGPRPARAGEHLGRKRRRRAPRRACPLLPRRRTPPRRIPGPPLRGRGEVEGGQGDRLIVLTRNHHYYRPRVPQDNLDGRPVNWSTRTKTLSGEGGLPYLPRVP